MRIVICTAYAPMIVTMLKVCITILISTWKSFIKIVRYGYLSSQHINSYHIFCTSIKYSSIHMQEIQYNRKPLSVSQRLHLRSRVRYRQSVMATHKSGCTTFGHPLYIIPVHTFGYHVPYITDILTSHAYSHYSETVDVQI